MSFLILSILCSTAIFLIFKAFGVFKLNTFQAIVSNYLIAAVFGLMLTPERGIILERITEPWVIIGLSLGALFIGLFYLMAYTSQHVGISAASVAAKMSLVLSMILLVWIEVDEVLTIWKVIGLLFAIPGVILSSSKSINHQFNWSMLIYPAIIFTGSALIDTALAFCEKNYLHGPNEQAAFSSLPFIGAFIIGSIVLVIRKFSLNQKFRLTSLAGGLVLGVVNYGSIYFLIRTLDTDLLDSSSLIPVNNLGVVVFSSLLAVIIYKEQLSTRNKLGIAFSLLAILTLFL